MSKWTWSFAPIAMLSAATTVVAAQQPARPNLLQVTSHVSAERVTVGDRFSVTLDLAPAAKMHVYAPTVVNYKPCLLYTSPSPRD